MSGSREQVSINHLTIGRRGLLKSGAAIAVLSSGIFTGTLANAQEPVRGGTLRLGFSADPGGFDPAQGPSGMSHVVIEQIYSTLMSVDENALPYPDLAKSYEMSEDGLQYTFRLREGVTFHNGDPLTAEDVKFTFDRLRDPDSGYSYQSQVETIEDVEAVDDLTVVFKLSRPTGPFLTYMAFPGSSIVPKALLESGHNLNAEPIGSGPFKFVSYQPRSMIRFERNENFYEAGKPYFDGMEFHLIADVTALTNAVLSGTINFSNEIPPRDWQRVKDAEGIVGLTLEGSRFYWLLPNNETPPMDNPLVRQAIAHAIDRSAIVAGTFYGQAVPFKGGVIPEWNWAHADIDYFSEGADPERARELLSEAGYPEGFETSLTMASSFPAMVSMAPVIQANLAAVGIRVQVSTMEIPRYWDEVWGPSNFGMTAMYWVSPLADPDDFVYNNYACGTGINVQKSCDAEMDALLEEAKSGTTEKERKEVYRRQQELSLEQMPIVPLVNSYILTAHTDALKSYKPMRTGFLKTLKDAWLEG